MKIKEFFTAFKGVAGDYKWYLRDGRLRTKDKTTEKCPIVVVFESKRGVIKPIRFAGLSSTFFPFSLGRKLGMTKESIDIVIRATDSERQSILRKKLIDLTKPKKHKKDVGKPKDVEKKEFFYGDKDSDDSLSKARKLIKKSGEKSGKKR